MKGPIFYRFGSIRPVEVSRFEQMTGRLMIGVHGIPSECVLDVEEELLDKFAGQAMAALIIAGRQNEIGDYVSIAVPLAEDAYRLAQAMLERKRLNATQSKKP